MSREPFDLNAARIRNRYNASRGWMPLSFDRIMTPKFTLEATKKIPKTDIRLALAENALIDLKAEMDSKISGVYGAIVGRTGTGAIHVQSLTR